MSIVFYGFSIFFLWLLFTFQGAPRPRDLLLKLDLFTGQVQALYLGVDQAFLVHHVSHGAMGVWGIGVQHLDRTKTCHAGDLILQLFHLRPGIIVTMPDVGIWSSTWGEAQGGLLGAELLGNLAGHLQAWHISCFVITPGAGF